MYELVSGHPMILWPKLEEFELPLGEFLDEQLARVRGNENIEEPIIDDSDDEGSPNDYVLPVLPKGYVMNEAAAMEILACNDRNDLKK